MLQFLNENDKLNFEYLKSNFVLITNMILTTNHDVKKKSIDDAFSDVNVEMFTFSSTNENFVIAKNKSFFAKIQNSIQIFQIRLKKILFAKIDMIKQKFISQNLFTFNLKKYVFLS